MPTNLNMPPVLGMPTEKVMYVPDTDASVVAISGIPHQEQEWKGRTVLRPIVNGSKVLSDTDIKYGAPKAEMFAVVIFVEKTGCIWAAGLLNYGSTTGHSAG